LLVQLQCSISLGGSVFLWHLNYPALANSTLRSATATFSLGVAGCWGLFNSVLFRAADTANEASLAAHRCSNIL
jgi:hypothetical protein